MFRRLFFAGCSCCDDGVVVLSVPFRVLLGVVMVPRLTGVRRRFGEAVVDVAARAVFFGDDFPVENGAAVAAFTGCGVDGDDAGVVAAVEVFVADPDC
jgi:hypothetical protein